MHQISAVSFILSLIEEASDKDVEAITEILFNPLLISFPDSVKKYLEKELENASGKITHVAQELIARLEKHHENLKSANDIKELQPSEAHRETCFRRDSRRMSLSQEEAAKKSILRTLVTSSVMLYGNKSIYYTHHGPEKQATRQEVPLQEFNYSVELPTLDFLDHNRLEYMLYSFRLEGCSS